MSNLIDADVGTERFSGYEAELKLVQADLNQQIDQIKETTGEPRKAAISRAERALQDADELVGLSPTNACDRAFLASLSERIGLNACRTPENCEDHIANELIV